MLTAKYAKYNFQIFTYSLGSKLLAIKHFLIKSIFFFCESFACVIRNFSSIFVVECFTKKKKLSFNPKEILRFGRFSQKM